MAGELQSPVDPVRTLRSRSIGLDRDALKQLLSAAKSSVESRAVEDPSIELNLFGDTSFPLVVTSVAPTSDTVGYVLRGNAGYSGEGTAILTLYGGAVAGTVKLENGEFYEIFIPTSGYGEVKQQEFRGYGGAPDYVLPEAQELIGAALSGSDSSKQSFLIDGGHQAASVTTLDVLIAYTARARQARGDAAGMLAHINNVFAQSNLALEKSGSTVELRLVDTVEVAWNDSSSSVSYNTTLTALRSTTDKQMDEVHARRDASGADLVSLWISPPIPSSGTFTVGLAYLLMSNPSSFASYAFSVVHQSYAGGTSLSFPHEIGHNLGLNHDSDHGGSNGGYLPDAKGYQQKALSPTFFTIMAYSSGCSGCKAIDQFSNPDVEYSGIPTGIVNDINAVRTLEAVKSAASGWRGTATPSCSFSLSSSSVSVAYTASTTSTGVTSTSGCSWTAASNASWITVTGGGSGSGNGTVSLSIAANTTQSSRTGTVTIAGKSFTVSQAAAPAPCSYTLSSTSASVGYGIGTASVNVSSGSGCAWTAVSNAGWISVTGGASGSANGKVTLSIAENTTQSPRTGTVTVAGKTFTVTQAAAPAPCSFSLSSTSASVGYGISTASVNVSSGSGCAWTAVSNAGWISVTGGASGSANGKVTLSIAENTTQSSRTGTVTVAGKTFTVTQAAAPAPCSHSLSSTSASVGYGISTASVNVSSGSGCAWTAVSNAGWISVTGGASGSANGTVTLSIAENTTQSSRTGTVTVAGKTFTVTQAAAPAPCSYSIGSSSTSVGSQSATANVSVSAGSGCTWSASSNSSWISIVSGTNGSGNGSVSIAVAENTTQNGRTGTVTIAGQTFTVLQAAAPAPCTYAISQTSASVGYGAGNASVGVNAGSGCSWQSTSNAAWITVVSGSKGTGNGGVQLAIAENQSQSSRTGTVTIAGNTFTVVQVGAPAPCSYSLSGTSSVVSYASTSLAVSVNAGSGCSWNAVSNVNWISVASGSSGSGNGGVSLAVASNSSLSPRSGTVTIAGKTFTVQQEAAPPAVVCSYTLSSSSLPVSSGGGNVSTQLQAGSGCSWNAESSASWLQVISGTSGSGPGTITVAAQPNSSASARTGTVTVAGQILTIQQAGQPTLPGLTVSPADLILVATEGSKKTSTTTASVSTGEVQTTFSVGTPSVSWLRVKASSSSTPANIEFFADPTGLQAGTHTATVNVTANGTSNGQQTITVSFNVERRVKLRSSPRGLSFRDRPGAREVTSQEVRVRLSGSTTPIHVHTSRPDWLSATAEYVGKTWKVKVSADASNLDPGIYDGSVNIGCLTTECDAESIPVRLEVSEHAQLRSGEGQEKVSLIASGGIVNAASFQQGIAEGAWMSIFGSDLSETARLWTLEDFAGDTFPRSLDGVQVKVAGKPAAIHYVSSTQVNFQAPDELDYGWVPVEITTPFGSDTAFVFCAKEAPGFFQASSDGQVAALHPDGQGVGLMEGEAAPYFRPAKPGSVIAVYGTGFGPTDPDVKPGEIYRGAAELIAKGAVRVLVGGVEADVQFAGLTGAGLNQVNVKIPELPRGTYELQAIVDGVPTQFEGKVVIE